MTSAVTPSTQGADRPSEPSLGRDQRRLSRAMVGLLIGYVLIVLVLMVVRGAYMSPDLFLVFAAVIAVALGRTRLFLRDWLPFVAIFLAWESMRGLADNLGVTVHSDDVVAVERFLFFGNVPSVVLQGWLHQPGSVNALDLATTGIYIAHFALPLTVGLLFWIFERPMYFRYVMTLMLMTFTAFVFFLLLPVAPPRFASAFGSPLPVVDIARSTFEQLHFAPVTTWLYGSINGNAVAAFPSIHSAYPLLAFFFVREKWPRAGWAMLAYSAAVWFSVVYLGHHYVVDVLGGIALATAAYGVSRAHWLGGLARRLTTFGRRGENFPAD